MNDKGNVYDDAILTFDISDLAKSYSLYRRHI